MVELDETLDAGRVGRYLGRLGLLQPPQPTLEALRLLITRHLETVPFENADIVDRRPILLGARRAVDKIVERSRGGFCFELNEAFRSLLVALGYAVRRIEARVWVEERRAYGAPYDHLALVVTLPEGDYLVDVGFGDNNRAPVRLPEDDVQDVSGVYHLRTGETGFLVLERPAAADAPARPLYRMTLDAQPLSAFEGMCAFHQTEPTSMFMRGFICTRATPSGRTTMTHDRLIMVENGRRSERHLDGGTERDRLLHQFFGFHCEAINGIGCPPAITNA